MTTLSDIDRLYAAVLAEPHDDTPRLVWADAIEERGEPGDAERAEFVRVQIELARGECDRPSLLIREQKLFVFKNGNRATHRWGLGGTFRHTVRETHSGLPSFDQRKDTCALFRRGFIERVNLPLAAFCGGPCERCGDYDTADNWIDHPRLRGCKACDGTGRTEGLAGPLFAAHPITAVRLTDREPDTIDDINACWVRHRHGLTESEAVLLPDGLFDMLRGGQKESAGAEWRERFGVEDEWVNFPTPEAAHAALSDACCAYGREQAKKIKGALTCPTPSRSTP